MDPSPESVRSFIEYLRDLGVYDLYRHQAAPAAGMAAWLEALPTAGYPPPDVPRPAAAQAPTLQVPSQSTPSRMGMDRAAGPTPSRDAIRIKIQSPAQADVHASESLPAHQPVASAPPRAAVELRAVYEPKLPAGPYDFSVPVMPITPFNQLAPLPRVRVGPTEKAAALDAVRNEIGDCTRCPLAYAGRHSIVYADGDPNARILFVGEGPGADEDEKGIPFVGKAGQLLNNMITAMGLKREAVYIANIVKCRPPKNRVPEPVEANTCSPFLLRQIDIVQPEIIVALGSTAAHYLLGLRQPLSALRNRWHDVRGSKCIVTYHPAFLLRDPRKKGEAWQDLQQVMVELKLEPPRKTKAEST